MAIKEEAQQKALLPCGMINRLKVPDGKVQQMLQQDKEKFLASILIPQVEPLRIPLISPIMASDDSKSEIKKKRKQAGKKSRNAFVRSFKKFLYFKPKTFWGTQILVPILSTVIGIWVTAVIKQPKIERLHHHRPPITQQAVTNTPVSVSAVSTNMPALNTITRGQIANSFNLLLQLYQSVMTNQTGNYTEKVMSCPTCKYSILIGSTESSPTNVKCLVCNQALQNLPRQEESRVHN